MSTHKDINTTNRHHDAISGKAFMQEKADSQMLTDVLEGCIFQQQAAISFFDTLQHYLSHLWDAVGTNPAFLHLEQLGKEDAVALADVFRSCSQEVMEELEADIERLNDCLHILDKLNELCAYGHALRDVQDDLIMHQRETLQDVMELHAVRAFPQRDGSTHLYCQNSKQLLLSDERWQILLSAPDAQSVVTLHCNTPSGDQRSVLTALYSRSYVYSGLDALLLLKNYILQPLLSYFDTVSNSTVAGLPNMPEACRLAYWIVTNSTVGSRTTIATWLEGLHSGSTSAHGASLEVLDVLSEYRAQNRTQQQMKQDASVIDDALFATMDIDRIARSVAQRLLRVR